MSKVPRIAIISGEPMNERLDDGTSVPISKRRADAWREYQDALKHDAKWAIKHAGPYGVPLPDAPSINES